MIELAPGVQVSESEFEFRATQSGGPGGQNVNKVATRVQLRWALRDSPSVTDELRERLLAELATRIDTRGVLTVTASRGRTQSENRRLALERLQELVRQALAPRKKRLPTRRTRSSVRKRLEEKRRRGDIKRDRQDPQ